MSLRADEAFAEWYERERPKVLASMMFVARDADLAADVTSEAFARALERWDRVGQMSSPGGWVNRVALNVLKRWRRRRALEERLLGRQFTPSPEEGPSVFDQELWDAVAGLPDRMRQAVALRYVADLREGEVAEIMGVAEGTVAATLSKARRKLAQALGEHEEVARG